MSIRKAIVSTKGLIGNGRFLWAVSYSDNANRRIAGKRIALFAADNEDALKAAVRVYIEETQTFDKDWGWKSSYVLIGEFEKE